MAKTKGHGNPAWNRDETILALALYITFEHKLPPATHAAVKELSAVLRAMPYHPEASKNAVFRNVASVAFKLQNLRQVATGQGLANVSRTDRQVWEEFGHQRSVAVSLAAEIRSALNQPGAPPVVHQREDLEFFEGRLLTTLHLRRERDPLVRANLLNLKAADGLRCEICGLSRPELPIEYQEAVFEAHHILPLAAASERKTKLTDMALLCANCHRLIHRLILKNRIWMTISEARDLLTGYGNS